MPSRDATKFFDAMLAAAEADEREEWGELFYQFWFPGAWREVDPGVRTKLVNSTLPNTIHEIEVKSPAVEYL